MTFSGNEAGKTRIDRSPPWPHAPTHRLAEAGTYFVTAGTYHKEHYFRGSERLRLLHNGLLKVADKFGWQLEAWAVFSNHYHFVGHSPADEDSAESLATMLGLLHEKTAKRLNKMDQESGRKVWHNFWDTRLTFQKSYLVRLSYTHRNAVWHGLVARPEQYPWCSASWFQRVASRAQQRTIYALKIDRVSIADDYDPAPEW